MPFRLPTGPMAFVRHIKVVADKVGSAGPVQECVSQLSFVKAVWTFENECLAFGECRFPRPTAPARGIQDPFFFLCGSGSVLKASSFGVVLGGCFPALLNERSEVLDATPTSVRPQERRRVALMRQLARRLARQVFCALHPPFEVPAHEAVHAFVLQCRDRLASEALGHLEGDVGMLFSLKPQARAKADAPMAKA